MYPSASNTAISLRTVADETPRLWRSTSDFDPIGSLVETKSATIARSTSKRRSSALAIRIHLSNLTHFTVITSRDRCSHPHPPAVPARIVAARANGALLLGPFRPASSPRWPLLPSQVGAA